MKVRNPFDLLPDVVSLDTFIPSAKRPGLLTMSGELLQKYKRDFIEGSATSSVAFLNHRIYGAGMHVLPFLTETIDTKRLRALEVGSGEGPYSAILSHAFSEYVGVEIEAESVERAEAFCKKFGCKNVHFVVDEAANLERFLARQRSKFDVIILHALIEHLLPEERFSVLKSCWDHLDDNGYLFIGETPSNIFPEDRHSSFMPYFQQMQVDLWPHFYKQSGNTPWQQSITLGIKNNTLSNTAYRRGVSVGYREFEKGLNLKRIEQLRPHIVSDNYNTFLMNRFSNYSRLDFLKLCEIRQLQQQSSREPGPDFDLPQMFSRHYLEVLLRKGAQQSSPQDWTALSLSNSASDTSEIVVEGKLLEPGAKLRVKLPGVLEKTNGPVQIMIQVIRPGDGGVLRCKTDSGRTIYESDLWKTMHKVSLWTQRMVIELPSVSASDFPLEFTAAGKGVSLSYVFLRSENVPAQAQRAAAPAQPTAVAPSKNAQNAEAQARPAESSLSATREGFWKEFLSDHLRLDDLTQELPQPSGKGYLVFMMPTPEGSSWLAVHCDVVNGEVGVSLSATQNSPGERAVNVIMEDWDAVSVALGATAQLTTDKNGRGRVIDTKLAGNLNDAVVRRRAFEWLAERVNTFINVVRPRIRYAVADDAAARSRRAIT